MNQSRDFLRNLQEVYRQAIPQEVMERARESLLDYLAVTSAGARFQQKKLKEYITFAQPESGQQTAIGMHRKLALKEAVFLNGLNGHALDFDDGSNAGIIHLGSPIFSLLLPLSERYGISTEKVLRAAIIGYEVSYTMAITIQPLHKALGYHATGTCGTLGAAIAASYLLDFSEQERFETFAAACVSASGMLKVLDDESELKPYNVAKASLLALTSLQMAKAGFKGHHDPLGGRGFFYMMTGKESVELQPVLSGGSYALMKTYTKPYASCRYTHPAVEAAIRLRAHARPDEVERIEIKTYALAVYGHEHAEIPNSYSAKMSIPYAVAVGFLFGKASLQEFEEETVKNPDVLSLAAKVHVQADEVLSRAFPGKQTTILQIVKRDGCVLSERVDYPKGEPENPLSKMEFQERYEDLMEYAGIHQDESRRIFDLVFLGDCPARYVLENL